MWAKRFSIIASLLVVAGCTHTPKVALQPTTAPTRAATTLSARDAAVLEAALRDRLKNAGDDRTIFLSVGSIETDWKDPPPDFFRRLSDLPYKFKPVSQARMPKDGEMESPNRFRGVEDPATGKRSWIYWAEIKQWVSDMKVRVDVGVWSGPLGGGGSICVFELRDGKWVFTDMEDGWVS
jgi:hypothetical protein